MADPRIASFISAKPIASLAQQTLQATPPNFGQMVIPHIATLAGQVGMAGSAYLNADEALRDDPENSERMKADCSVTEPLEARQRATSLLDWKIAPEEGDDSNDSKELAKQLTRILRRTPRLTELLRCTTEAIWTGRSGVACSFSSELVGDSRRLVCHRWEPRNGDKLVFRYDDGSGKHDPSQVGIRVGMGTFGTQYNREQIEYTESGMVYWFTPDERKTVIVHKHMLEDGPFENPVLAGRIHGVGIRSKIYWTWYAMVECMQNALHYLDRSAHGIQIWKYPANNHQAEAAVIRAASKQVSGRSFLTVPVWPGDQSDLYGVELVEPGLGGVDRLLTVIKEIFRHSIKRYIIGQTLTSEADATGLGSGVADAHIQTFADIIKYDAVNLQETISLDFLRQLQLLNFPSSRNIYLEFKLLTEGDKADEKLDRFQKAWEMGAKIPAADLADAAGFTEELDPSLVVFNPQIVSGIQQSISASIPTGPLSQVHSQMSQSIMSSLGIPPQ